MNTNILSIHSLKLESSSLHEINALSFALQPGECLELSDPLGFFCEHLFNLILSGHPCIDAAVQASFIPQRAAHALHPTRSLKKQLNDINPNISPDHIYAYLDLFEIPHHRLSQSPQSLSGGNQQLASIILALISRPKLIIAHNPTTALDSHKIDIVHKHLKSLVQSGTALLILNTERYSYPYHTRRIALSQFTPPNRSKTQKEPTNRPLVSIQDLMLNPYGTVLLKTSNLCIPENSTIGLFGPNGCGKSTLIKAILQRTPYSGDIIMNRIILNKKNVFNLPNQLSIQALFQDTLSSFPPLQKLQHILCEPNTNITELKKLLTLFDIREGWEKRTPEETPLAILQAIAIARVFARQPTLLLLDEPTNHLSVKNRSLTAHLIQKRTQSTLIISHDIKLLNQVCSKIYAYENQSLRLIYD